MNNGLARIKLIFLAFFIKRKGLKNMENKKEIRKQMKAYRAGLKTEKKKQMDQAILTHFFEIERIYYKQVKFLQQMIL